MKQIFLLIPILLGSSLLISDDLSVPNSSGISNGFYKNGVINWNDIPYALPPIGELRWKAPQKIAKNNEFIKPKDNNFCIQKPSGMGGSESTGDEFFSGSEDCLYLDIKAPHFKSDKL